MIRETNPVKVDWGNCLSTIPIVRGSISDRPWGLTLGALGNEQRSVELSVRAGDRTHTVTFDRGQVIGATSPLAVDSALRVALTAHIVSSLRANQVKRAIAAAPNLDELDVLGAAAQLTAEQLGSLRQRILLQRAARTFALDNAEYEVAEREPLAAAPAVRVDIGAVIYLGVRMNLSEQRLGYDMRQLGTHFMLKHEAIEQLERFGFGRTEQPIIDALIRGTSLPELEATYRDIDPRTTQSVVYALAACDAVVETRTHDAVPKVAPARAERHTDFDRAPSTRQRVLDAIAMRDGDAMPDAEFSIPDATPHILPLRAPPAPTRPPAEVVVTFVDNPRGIRIDTPLELPVVPADTPLEIGHALETRPADSAVVSAMLDPHSVDTRPVSIVPTQRARTKTPPSLKVSDPFEVPTLAAPPSLLSELLDKAVPPDGERSTKPRSMLDSFRTGAMTTVRPNALSRTELILFIAERIAMLDQGVDHFTLLGIPIAAPIEHVHAAYIEIARNLHPKRLAELRISDDGFHAARLLAQVGIAFTVLTDRVLRPEYIATLRRTMRHAKTKP